MQIKIHAFKDTSYQTDKTNNALSAKKIKYRTKIFSTKRNQDSDGFFGEFNQTFKENIIPIFYKLIL